MINKFKIFTLIFVLQMIAIIFLSLCGNLDNFDYNAMSNTTNISNNSTENSVSSISISTNITAHSTTCSTGENSTSQSSNTTSENSSATSNSTTNSATSQSTETSTSTTTQSNGSVSSNSSVSTNGSTTESSTTTTTTTTTTICPPGLLPAANYYEIENTSFCAIPSNGAYTLAESSGIVLTVGSTKTISGWSDFCCTSGGGEYDYIAFTVPISSTVTISVAYGTIGIPHELDFLLYSGSASFLNVLTNTSTEGAYPASLTVGTVNLVPGLIYYLVVKDRGPESQMTDYKFTLTATSDCILGTLPSADYQETENQTNVCKVDLNGSCSSTENTGFILTIGNTKTVSGWSEYYSTGNGLMDFVSFNLSTTCSLTAYVTYGNLLTPHDLDFYIYNNSSCTKVLSNTASEGTFPTFLILGSVDLAPGTYFIAVKDKGSTGQITDYFLTLTTTNACIPGTLPTADYQETENRIYGCNVDLNGTTSNAEATGLTFAIGSTKSLSGWSEKMSTGYGYRDLFSFTLSSTCKLCFNINYGNLGTPHNLDFNIYNSSFVLVFTNTTVESTFPVTASGCPSLGGNVIPGFYYLEIIDEDSSYNRITDYRIELSTKPPCLLGTTPTANYQESENRVYGCGVDFNGSCTAFENSGLTMTISDNKTISGWSEHYTTGNGLADFISFSLSTTCSISVSATYGNLGIPHNIDFALLNESCGTMLLSNTVAEVSWPSTLFIGATNASSGRYKLKITDLGGSSEITDYVIYLSVGRPLCGKDCSDPCNTTAATSVNGGYLFNFNSAIANTSSSHVFSCDTSAGGSKVIQYVAGTNGFLKIEGTWISGVPTGNIALEVLANNCITGTSLFCESTNAQKVVQAMIPITAGSNYYLWIGEGDWNNHFPEIQLYLKEVTPGFAEHCSQADAINGSGSMLYSFSSSFRLDENPPCFGGPMFWSTHLLYGVGNTLVVTSSVPTSMALYMGTCGSLTLIDCVGSGTYLTGNVGSSSIAYIVWQARTDYFNIGFDEIGPLGTSSIVGTTNINSGTSVTGFGLSTDGVNCYAAWGQSTPDGVQAAMYNGTTWSTMGGMITSTNSTWADIELVNGSSYVSYVNPNTGTSGGNAIYVKSYNGSTWNLVANSPFTSGNCGSWSYVTMAQGAIAPHVVHAGSGGCGITDQTITATSLSWFALGTSSSSTMWMSGDLFPDIIYSNSQPYVSLVGNNLAEVKTFNGLSWDLLGSTTLNVNVAKSAFATSIAESKGRIYCAWVENNTGSSYDIYLKMYFGGIWTPLGTPLSLETPNSSYRNISIAANHPFVYVVWAESSTGTSLVKIQKWNGVFWEAPLTLNNNNTYNARSPEIVLVNSVPYVGFMEYDSSSNFNLHVKKVY